MADDIIAKTAETQATLASNRARAALQRAGLAIEQVALIQEAIQEIHRVNDQNILAIQSDIRRLNARLAELEHPWWRLDRFWTRLFTVE